jgi:lipocalin
LPGIATAPNSNEPNRLIISFNQTVGPVRFVSGGPYNVVDTDYETYSLVYSCEKIAYFFKTESSFIFTRNKTIDSQKLEEIKKKFVKEISQNLIKTNQSCDFN